VIRFGTDGIRGVAGERPITAEVGVAVGRAAARPARRHGSECVVVGRDPRPSGAMLASAVAAGVAAEGALAVSAGTIPTSGVAVCAEARGAGGVVVTASHNPEEDNGFKVFAPGGRKPDDAEQADLEAWIAAAPTDGPVGDVRDEAGPCLATYTDALRRELGDLGPLAGRRVALDLANGAAVALKTWLAEIVPGLMIVGGGDGPINGGCGAVHPGALAEAVRAGECDAGIAVDGDADRCVLVDERGLVVPGDALAWLLARGLRASVLAVTVMSTGALEPALPGVRVVRTAVGDRALAHAIAHDGATLGCEESGHVLFSGGLPAGDGLLTGLRALSLAWSGGRGLSDVLAPFAPFPRRLTRVRVASRVDLDAALGDAVATGEAALGPGGRVFLRYSGTEPVLRLLVEGADEAVVQRVSDAITARAAEVLA